MAPIKSAWEIALENTKDIEGSKETLAASAARDEGRKLAAKALDDPSFGLKEALKAVDRDRIALVREGLIQSLLANLVLPLDEFALRKNKQVGAAVGGHGLPTPARCPRSSASSRTSSASTSTSASAWSKPSSASTRRSSRRRKRR